MTKEYYFAYGSNMSFDRMLSRTPSVRRVGIACLDDKRMVFNKKGADGSGKANLVNSPEDITWGVLYEIDNEELHALDRREGDYDRIRVQVRIRDEGTVTAWTYTSGRLADESVAYDWYKDLVLLGAREHDLPQEYITYIETLPSKPSWQDPK